MSYNNNNNWNDERAVIKDNAFNRGVSGVRKTQHGLQAMPAPGQPAQGQAVTGQHQAVQTHQGLEHTSARTAPHTFKSPNMTQSRMQAMSASQAMREQNTVQARMPGYEQAAQWAAVQAAQVPTQEDTMPFGHGQYGQAQQKPLPSQMPLTQEQIEERAFYDPLTSTHNFRFLVRMLDREIRRARFYNRPLSVLVIAIPSLKLVKAQYGLLPYSLALTGVAQTLLRACGPIDLVGKYGDERFLYVCPEKSLEQAAELADQLRAAFETLVIPCQYPIRLPPSIGLATYSQEFSELESLIAVADLGADLVIQRGGNGFSYAPNEV
jgi:diguanylate cyclase (GGDEF)-like protein